MSENSASIIHLTVNGEPRELRAGTTMRELVSQFGMTPEKVAIELNRKLARKDKYDQVLSSGDVIEIVTFVGGG